MSTILKQRNITIQENIRRTESIEDMRTFLKCLRGIQDELLEPEEELKYISVREATNQFRSLWERIVGVDTLDRFNSTYNLPVWECRVGLTGTYIKSKSTTGYSAAYDIFILIRSSNGECRLVISSLNCKEMYFDGVVNVLRQIDGTNELKSLYAEDAVFEIDFDKL